MASVAIIGPDGAGKTTLTRLLEKSGVLPFRYLYMGVDLKASNIALPTSRLFQRLKAREHASQRSAGTSSRPHGRLRPFVRRTLRLVGLLAEEWFRQIVSWYYQRRGFTMLYDRHFVFDYAPGIVDTASEPLDRRIHNWFLQHLYPRPGLVIFLNAPGAVLYARKGESTPEELERRRQVFLQIGKTMPRFVTVDATRPLPEVYAEVAQHVIRFASEQRGATRMKRHAVRSAAAA